MGTESFYKSIFPPQGLRALAVFKQGLGAGRPPTHHFFDNNEDFIAAASTWDGLGKNVYHGCAVYSTDANRQGSNVAAVKTLWADLDVGPNKPYKTAQEAAQSLESFRVAAALPAPYLVKSGGGIHAYFPFTKAIAPDQWRRLAGALAACMDHFDVKHDTSRTQDIASILRVPGTSNYKTDPAKAVRILREGEESSAATIWRALRDYANANALMLEAKPSGPAATNDLIGSRDFPPSHGDIVAEHCAVLEEVATTGGDVPYEIWWRAMGVAAHTTEPAVTAAHWTRNRGVGHDNVDWQGVTERWATGPTTCKQFSNHSDKCKQCPHFGKIGSPIRLGLDEQPVIEPVLAEPAEQAEESVDGELKPAREWLFAADWIVDAVCKATRTGYTNGRMTMSTQQEDGSYKHVTFCDRYWQVMRRVRGIDNTWQLEIGYQQYGRMKTFMLNSADVTAPDKLRAVFSTFEIHIYGGTRAMLKAQEIIRWEQDVLYGAQEETPTYPIMGWVTEGNAPRGEMTGQFVLGDTLITPKAPKRAILLDQAIDHKLRAGFTTKGTTEEWIELVNRIYNRSGAAPYQFAICAAFASPLVKLCPGEGDWHGIPVALTGASGAAKTTTALAAMSIYAPPQNLRFNANRQKGGQGDTINAFANKIGSLQNIPFISDEMTSVDPEDITGVMFMLANGTPKDRSTVTGKLVTNYARWDVISIITGNESLHDKIKQIKNSGTKEAASLRCFEVPLAETDMQKIFWDVNKTTVEHDLIASQFGCVGRDWLQFVVNNRAKIEDLLGERRAVYKIDGLDRSAIRFYKDLLVTVETAALLAKKRGFIDFDVPAMMRWARSRVADLRDGVFERDWTGAISDFIASLHGRTIVTRHMKLGRGRRSTPEMPLEPLNSARAPVARRAVEDRLMFVTTNAVADWCRETNTPLAEMTREMIAGGYILARGGKAEPCRVAVGSGTTVSRPNSPCWELDFDKIGGYSDENPAAAGDDNVVQFPGVVTDSVTTASESDPSSAVSP